MSAVEFSESQKAISRLQGKKHLDLRQIQMSKYSKFTDAYDKQEEINARQKLLATQTMNSLTQKNLEHLHAAFGNVSVSQKR